MIDRRAFLKNAISLGVAPSAVLSLGACATPDRQGVHVPPMAAEPKTSAGGAVAFCLRETDKTCLLRVIDWEGHVLSEHRLPVSTPHSITQSRRDPNVVYAFEIFGSCAKVDLKSGAITKVEHRGAKFMFNGHGVLGLDDDKMICSEIIEDPFRSVVTVRDPVTLERIAIAPVDCNNSHQVIHLPGSTVVACGNMRTPRGDDKGAITFFDYAKMKIVKQVEFDYPIIHLVPLSEGEALGIARPVEISDSGEKLLLASRSSAENMTAFNASTKLSWGPVCYASVRGDKRLIWNEARKDVTVGGFAVGNLSRHGAVVSTHTVSGSVLLWQDGDVRNSVKANRPEALVVSKDQSRIMVHQGQNAVVYEIPTMKILKTISFDKQVMMMNGYSGAYG